mmetsp:Transcript_69409/g.224456  ORF Transcript_69409/g.224456 Transcript_69409/m.224456 type:complete len:215 (+) Transcript_69409:832-1476(+)
MEGLGWWPRRLRWVWSHRHLLRRWRRPWCCYHPWARRPEALLLWSGHHQARLPDCRHRFLLPVWHRLCSLVLALLWRRLRRRRRHWRRRCRRLRLRHRDRLWRGGLGHCCRLQGSGLRPCRPLLLVLICALSALVEEVGQLNVHPRVVVAVRPTAEAVPHEADVEALLMALGDDLLRALYVVCFQPQPQRQTRGVPRVVPAQCRGSDQAEGSLV